MAELFSFLTAWLAPITCFTAEEAWLARPKDVPDGAAESVHLRLYPAIPEGWLDPAAGERWKTVRAVRRVVTGALELERAEKRIGSSLQAAPHVHVAPEYLAAMKGLDLREIFITSGGDLTADAPPAGAFSLPDIAGVAVVPALASGQKCARCWQVLDEVGKSATHPLLCLRCEAAVESA
jgi:isoleucyl-tRNA synthetase